MFSEIFISILIVVAVGILSGFLGSIFGIGGGLIVTPFLTIILGLDIKYAIATSIIVVIATSSGSAIAYLKDNVINLRAAMFLEVFTTIGGLIGAILTGIAAPWILYVMFSCLLAFSAFNTARKVKKGEVSPITNTPKDKLATRLRLNDSYYDKNLNKEIKYNLKNVPGGSLVMLFAGAISGLLGIGSGIFKIIAFDEIMKMPLKPSSTTSNLMMGVTAASSSIVYFFNGSIQPDITVPVVIGVLAGAAIGSSLMPKLKQKYLMIGFVILMAFLCIQMISKAIGSF